MIKRLGTIIGGLALALSGVLTVPSAASASMATPKASTAVPTITGYVNGQAVTIHGARTIAHSVQPSLALASIQCGGTKYGSGWQTYPTGGYVGEGCGAGIDYIATPTSGESVYDFGITEGSSYTFQAWIPPTHATAPMNYSLYACGTELLDPSGNSLGFVNQANISAAWDTLYTLSGFSGCDIEVIAWSGAVHNFQLGLDAVRSHT